MIPKVVIIVDGVVKLCDLFVCEAIALFKNRHLMKKFRNPKM